MGRSLPPGGVTRNIPDKLIELVSETHMDADVRRAVIREWLSIQARRIQCHRLVSESLKPDDSELFIARWMELIEYSKCVPRLQLESCQPALKHPDTVISDDSTSKLNAEHQNRVRGRSRDGGSHR
jgi:hypothetical protein